MIYPDPPTHVCGQCKGTKLISTYAATSQRDGILKLRVLPKTPRPCSCITTTYLVSDRVTEGGK